MRFQYNNLMYMTAGYLGGQISKSSWEDLVKNALFTPLGMKRSNFTVAAMHADSNYAQAYELNTKREVVKIQHIELDAGGPAGSINSSVDEMARYARMMLAGGMFEGKRVLLEADVQAMMQPQMADQQRFLLGPFRFPELWNGLVRADLSRHRDRASRRKYRRRQRAPGASPVEENWRGRVGESIRHPPARCASL